MPDVDYERKSRPIGSTSALPEIADLKVRMPVSSGSTTALAPKTDKRSIARKIERIGEAGERGDWKADAGILKGRPRREQSSVA
jgi:hypothetical protein